ncbi:cell division protein FtsQ/DivIB [Bacteroidota bacterium]
MFKKILAYLGYMVLAAIPAAYLFFSSQITSAEISKLKCKQIKVTILDSAINRFVTPEEIKELVRLEGITVNESKIRHINQFELENLLNNKTAVKSSQVYVTGKGELMVEVRQRRPILRLETVNGGFYMDETAYLFPLMRSFTSYVPVVTGNIPLTLTPGFRGESDKKSIWAHKIKEMGLFLERERFWNSMIEQIYIDSTGTLELTPRVGKFEIVFGEPENIEFKFKKLEAFYTKVIPATGWEIYNRVDLRFSNQLVCKKREIKQIKT